MEVITLNDLYHHGVAGQKWGVRNGPPYPIKKVTTKATAKDANDIYNTLSLDDKRKITARKDPPKEFTNDKEYLSDVHLKSFMTKYKDVPVSLFDVWSEGDGDVALSLMTRGGDEYRGKGYASMAVKRGIEWIDNNPQIMTAYWDVRKDNVASIALAKKSGFRKMRGEGRDPAWTAYQKKYKR